MAKGKAANRNSDAWHRVAYLNQISQHVLLADRSGHSENLSRYYSSVLKQVCARLVLRLSADTKRAICKGCNGVLIPGVTSKARFMKKCGQSAFLIRCGSCGFTRRFPVDKKKTASDVEPRPEPGLAHSDSGEQLLEQP